MPQIADKLRREFNRAFKSRIISLDAYREGERQGAEIKPVEQLIKEGINPLHALYFRSDVIFLASLPDQSPTQPYHRQFDPRTFRVHLVESGMSSL